MKLLKFIQGEYRTPEGTRRPMGTMTASVCFYPQFWRVVWSASGNAKRGRYGNHEWASTSRDVMKALEYSGVRFVITGTDHFAALDGPCVFIGNHMSTLETMVLPCIVQPLKDVTFVVKQSLIDYPVFRYVMRSRNPITVGRTNPREDLVAVMEGGVERLKAGRSIIIFPQTTRADCFDPEQFNTIGVKLAKKAGVPVVPIALKTDAWSNGRFIKDFGKIDPSKTVYFAFGEPIPVVGRGVEEHAAVVRFIQEHLDRWANPFPG